jgi:hypothetical protein
LEKWQQQATFENPIPESNFKNLRDVYQVDGKLRKLSCQRNEVYSDGSMFSVTKFLILDSAFFRELTANVTHRQMFRGQRPTSIRTVIGLDLTKKRTKWRFKTTRMRYGNFDPAMFN